MPPNSTPKYWHIMYDKCRNVYRFAEILTNWLNSPPWRTQRKGVLRHCTERGFWNRQTDSPEKYFLLKMNFVRKEGLYIIHNSRRENKGLVFTKLKMHLQIISYLWQTTLVQTEKHSSQTYLNGLLFEKTKMMQTQHRFGRKKLRLQRNYVVVIPHPTTMENCRRQSTVCRDDIV